jgi:hypothetical protein
VSLTGIQKRWQRSMRGLTVGESHRHDERRDALTGRIRCSHGTTNQNAFVESFNSRLMRPRSAPRSRTGRVFANLPRRLSRRLTTVSRVKAAMLAVSSGCSVGAYPPPFRSLAMPG